LKTTATEFEEWKYYLDLEPNFFHREDYYWAQIASAIKSLFSTKPGGFPVEQSLLKFEKKKQPVVDEEKIKQEKIQQAKSTWKMWLGIGQEKKKKGR